MYISAKGESQEVKSLLHKASCPLPSSHQLSFLFSNLTLLSPKEAVAANINLLARRTPNISSSNEPLPILSVKMLFALRHQKLQPLTVLIFCFAEVVVGEFCQDESLEASCPEGEVILMESGQYGRSKINKCVQRDLGYLGCAVDVLRHLDTRCSGRRECSVSVMDPALRQLKPCPQDVSWHLKASCRCIPGEWVKQTFQVQGKQFQFLC